MKQSILVRLHGGLGNQLFQLLAARYKKASQGGGDIEIYINDLNFFQTNRSFEIEPLLRDENVIRSVSLANNYLFKSKISKLLGIYSLHSIATVKQLANWNGQFLNGYFQDLFSYNDLELMNIVIMDLEEDIKKSTTKFSCSLSNIVENSAAVHLRLTDFIHTEKGYNFLCEFRVPYLLKAAHWLRRATGISKIIVFTDDVKLAKKLLKSEEFIFFDDLQKHKFSILEEFYILSSFKNLITSNSTFSFWGSIFGSDKTIVFPSLWKPDDKRENYTFSRNIESHSKMFFRRNTIKII